MTNLMTFWPSNDMITDHTLRDMIDDHHDFLEPYMYDTYDSWFSDGSVKDPCYAIIPG